MSQDLINHPQHYESQAIVLEPIDFYEILPFCEGNALKYCFRAGHKEGSSELEDLKKARWYLMRSRNRSSLKLTEEQRADFHYMHQWLVRSNSPLLASIAATCHCYGDFFYCLRIEVEKRIKELEEGNGNRMDD